MKALSIEEKKNLLTTLPFPLAYLYQQMLAYQSFSKAQKTADNPYRYMGFWAMYAQLQLLSKIIGIVAVCDYLQNYQENQGNDELENLNGIILEYLQKGRPDWLELSRILVEFLDSTSQISSCKSNIPELRELLNPNMQLSDMSIPGVVPRKSYNYFEIMDIFSNLESQLFSGPYRLHLPGFELINSYIDLLEQLLMHCRFLWEYGLYVLISQDERKTRGFLCRGIKSQPVGIRGMSYIWKMQKRHPFLCRSDQRQYLSCFPFIAPMLQKRGDRIGLRDILFYEYADRNRMSFYGYRVKKMLSHQTCAQDAFDAWQKQLHWLQAHSVKPLPREMKIFNFDDLTQYHTRYFVGRTSIIQKIFDLIQQYPCAYLYMRGKAGYGKTAILSELYRHSQKLSSLDIKWKHKNYPIMVWHFCSQLAHHDDPMFILYSLYGQILEQAYHFSEHDTLLQLQKLPTLLTNLQKHFENLLEQVSREVLQPNQLYLMIVLDGLDEANFHPPSIPSLVACLPTPLPERVFFLMSWRITEDAITALPETFQRDGISVHRFRLTSTALIELPEVSPLPLLSFKEVGDWLSQFPIAEEERDDSIEILWKKSAGDPMYLGFLGDLCQHNINKRWLSDLPQGRYAFFQQNWESLSDRENFVCYRTLGFLAAMRDFARDEITEVANISAENIGQQIWEINIFLRGQGDSITIAHPAIRDYIYGQFRPDDQREFHRILASYYCNGNASGSFDYRELRNCALHHLPYHYYQMDDWQSLYNLVMDDKFKQEKLTRLNLYHNYLYDLAMALKACYQHRQYERLLTLGFRYAYTVREALHGIAHGFHAAAQGDYHLALDRIRTISDEQEFFKANLLILWYILYNGHGKDANSVLDELVGIADNQIDYISMGMDPWICHILKKLQKHATAKIDCIIGKHGLKNQESVRYLLELQGKIGFQGHQLKQLVQKLADAVQVLPTPREQKDCLLQMIPLCVRIESTVKIPELWKRLLSIVEAIEDLSVKIDVFQNLARHSEYLPDLVHSIHGISPTIENSEQRILHRIRYAFLIKSLGYLEEADELLERVLQEVQNPPSERNEEGRELEAIEGTGKIEECLSALCVELENQNDWQRQWVQRFCQKVPLDEKQHVNLIAALAASGDIDRSLQILEQSSTGDPAILKRVAQVLAQQPESSAIPHWNRLLSLISSSVSEDAWDILKQIARIILDLKIAEDNPLWETFISTWDRLGREEQLAEISSGMAQKGFLQKSQTIFAKLPKSVYRSQALLDIALKRIELKSDIEFAFEAVIELSELKQQMMLLSSITSCISSGDSGRLLWKKVTNLLKSMNWGDKNADTWSQYLIDISLKLMRDLPLDESDPLWQDIFEVIKSIAAQDAKERILEQIIIQLGNAPSFESTLSFWPLIEQCTVDADSGYSKARVYTAMGSTMGLLGQIGKAGEILEMACQWAQQEKNPLLALQAMAVVSSAYRELGKQGKCLEIFEEILRRSGLNEGRKLKGWDVYRYFVDLSQLGLEDLGILIQKKMLLAVVEVNDESPSPISLAHMAELCMELDYRPWMRQIFFRIIPHLPKEQEIGKDMLYLHVAKILAKIGDQSTFQELWERTQHMVLNFQKLGMQERFLEALAEVLQQRGGYEEHQSLWEKLLANARYVGNSVESIQICIRIVKHLVKIAPLRELERNFQILVQALEQLQSEYDRVNVLGMMAEMLTHFPQFDTKLPFWTKLIEIAQGLKKKECQGSALLHLIKSLVKRAQSCNQWELFTEIGEILEQIARPQQKCEGYAMIAREYQKANRSEECMAFIDKILHTGKDLGAFYYNKLLPMVIEYLISLEQISTAMTLIEQVTEEYQKVHLWLKIMEKTQNGSDIVERVLSHIPKLETQYGDQAKMYTRAALYTKRIEPNTISLFDRVFTQWGTIVNASFQKEIISFISTQLQAIGNDPILTDVWEKLYDRAKDIGEETYRFWAMEEIAKIQAGFGNYHYFFDLLHILPPSSEVKFHLLTAYADVAGEQARQLIAVLNPDEKEVYIKKLADTMETKSDIDGLFGLWLEMPDNFQLLCHLTPKILSVALKKEGRDCFHHWMSKIAPAWGLVGNIHVLSNFVVT